MALFQFYLFVRESPDAHERYPKIVPLLVTTVRNLLNDAFNQRQIEEKLKATLLGAPRVRMRLPDQELLGKELMDKARSALRRLPKSWRDVAYLVFFRNYKIVEAAEATNTVENTAKSRIHLARKVFAAVLGDYLKGLRK